MKTIASLLTCMSLVLLVQAQEKRPIAPSDLYRLQTISDPRLSPDGKWIVYSLSASRLRERQTNQ